MHEILVSEEEANHCVARGANYAIRPMLPELTEEGRKESNALKGEYSSADSVLDHRERWTCSRATACSTELRASCLTRNCCAKREKGASMSLKVMTIVGTRRS